MPWRNDNDNNDVPNEQKKKFREVSRFLSEPNLRLKCLKPSSLSPLSCAGHRAQKRLPSRISGLAEYELGTSEKSCYCVQLYSQYNSAQVRFAGIYSLIAPCNVNLHEVVRV